MKFKLAKDSGLLCPSARENTEGAHIFGVVGGTVEDPMVGFTTHPQPVSAELLELAKEVTPTEVFRFAAPCICNGCSHFKDTKCQIGKRLVELMPTVVDKLPPCSIRSDCRWWHQEGIDACLRCPQLVTDNYQPSDLVREVAGGIIQKA